MVIKITILGPSGAGKTTYIKALDENAMVITDRKGHTVGVDIGFIYYDRERNVILKKDEVKKPRKIMGLIKIGGNNNVEQIKIRLVSTPGQLRFKEVMEVVTKFSDGILFMIDSTRPDQVGEALVIYHEVRTVAPDIPIVIAANKQDLENALKPEEIGKLLGLENVKIFGISALRKWNLETPLVELIKLILNRKSRQQ